MALTKMADFVLISWYTYIHISFHTGVGNLTQREKEQCRTMNSADDSLVCLWQCLSWTSFGSDLVFVHEDVSTQEL